MKIKYFPFTNNTEEKNIRKDILNNPQKFIKDKLTGSKFDFGVSEITRTGAYKEMGFYYVVRPLLKNYVYRQYDNWHEIYALNKSNARKLIGGRIEKIIEVV